MIAFNCKEQTESTSGTSLLNSSKQPQAPDDARPTRGGQTLPTVGTMYPKFPCSICLFSGSSQKYAIIGTMGNIPSNQYRTEDGDPSLVLLTATMKGRLAWDCLRLDPPTLENIAEALKVHFRRTIKDVAALSQGSREILGSLGFPSAGWSCQGAPHFEVQRLRGERDTPSHNLDLVT